MARKKKEVIETPVVSTLDLSKPEIERKAVELPALMGTEPKVDIAKQEPKVETVTILVDKVTSGSAANGVFSFSYRGKMIQNAIFKVLPENTYYGYNHHIDNGNLKTFNPTMALFHYEECQKSDFEPADWRNLTLTSWMDVQRFLIITAIENGNFNKIGTSKDGTKVEVKVEWKGEANILPTLKQIQPKVKRENTKSKADLLDGLSF